MILPTFLKQQALQDMSKIIDEGGDVKKLMGLRQRIANLGKGGDVDANAARAKPALMMNLQKH